MKLIDNQDHSIDYISPSEIGGADVYSVEVLQSCFQLNFNLSLGGVLKKSSYF